MSVYYVKNIDKVDWREVAQLFSDVGWGERTQEDIQCAFQKSSFVRLAYIGGQLIGVGRTVDDGMYYGWIVDLAVSPEYQARGIGSHILKELAEDLKPFITTMLTSVPGKSGFYEKLG